MKTIRMTNEEFRERIRAIVGPKPKKLSTAKWDQACDMPPELAMRLRNSIEKQPPPKEAA